MMSPEQERELERLFKDALNFDGEERAAFVEKHCAGEPELRSRLLGFLEADARGTTGVLGESGGFKGHDSGTFGAASSRDGEPVRIGNYRIVEPLGRGGMGEVFRAVQEEPIRRVVALKIIKPGMDTKEVIARFAAERQALAMMNHVNVASVLDAGATEIGRPYFVMEYVQGQPITDYCDRHRLGNRDRLELFLAVCDGIQHAHQKGIIHRDIKPSNTLVTIQGDKAIPKVIDFGIAKAVSQPFTDLTLQTRLGQVIGTPGYMSPEQTDHTAQDIDTRSDIYSLGVLLYELLVGVLPLDPSRLAGLDLPALQQRIRDTDPPTPSSRLSRLERDTSSREAVTRITASRKSTSAILVRQLRGDLDWITMKALEKDRTRRYASVSELVADIRRYLSHQPVLAGRPGLGYRLRKAARRNRGVVIGAATLLVILVGALSGSLWMLRRVSDERDQKQAALTERSDALAREQQALRRATSDRQITESKRHLGTNPGRALLYALAADQVLPGPLVRDVALETLSVLRERRTLVGHDRRVRDARFNADGRLAVTASEDGTVRVWDARSGAQVARLDAPGAEPFSARFAPDGDVVSTYWDGTVRYWSVAKGQETFVVRGHRDVVYEAALSRDGHRMVTVSRDGDTRVWDLKAGREMRVLRPLDGHGTHPFCVGITGPGDRIAVGYADGSLLMWDLTSNAAPRVLLERGPFCFDVDFSADLGRLVSAQDDGSVVIWDAESAREVGRLRAHELSVWSVSFSPNGAHLVTASADGTAGVWNASTLREVETLRGHDGTVSAAAFSPDGHEIVTSSWDGTARIWRALGGDGVTRFSVSDLGAGCGAGFGFESTHLVMARGEEAWVLDVNTQTPGVRLTGHRGSVYSCEFGPDGRRIVTTSYDGTARIWDAGNGKELQSLDGGVYLGRPALVYHASFSPDGRNVVTASQDGRARIWNASTGEKVATLDGHESFVRSARFNPDGTRVITASLDGTVRIWSCATGDLVAKFELGREVTAASFSPDGHRVVAATKARDVHVYDALTGAVLVSLQGGHGDEVTDAGFSPDGQWVVTASADRTAVVWDAATGARWVTFKGHRGPVWRASFSRDSAWVVSSSLDRTVCVWPLRPLPVAARLRPREPILGELTTEGASPSPSNAELPRGPRRPPKGPGEQPLQSLGRSLEFAGRVLAAGSKNPAVRGSLQQDLRALCEQAERGAMPAHRTAVETARAVLDRLEPHPPRVRELLARLLRLQGDENAAVLLEAELGHLPPSVALWSFERSNGGSVAKRQLSEGPVDESGGDPLGPFVGSGSGGAYVEDTPSHLSQSTHSLALKGTPGSGVRLGTPKPLATLTQGDFTIHLWFKTRQSGSASLIGAGDDSTRCSLVLELGSRNHLRLALKNLHDSNSQFGAVSDLNVSLEGLCNANDDRWHAVSAVRSALTLELYLDGALVGSAPDASGSFVQTAETWHLGCGQAGSFAGQLDQVQIWGLALTASQIRKLAGAR